MEVHPPDHPIMTWKQFLIHMSTICLGLLIALGLDQAVEYLHHRHEGHQFEEDMRMEAQRNLEVIAYDHQALHRQADYYRSCRQALAAAKPEGSKWRVQLPSTPQGSWSFLAPSISVWTTGKESQLVPFIPAPRARLFDHLTYEFDLLSSLRAQFLHLVDEESDERAVAVGPSVGFESLSGVRNLLLTSEQRDQLDRIYTQLEGIATATNGRLSRFEEVTRAVVDGTPSLEAAMNASPVVPHIPAQSAAEPH